MCIVNLEIGVWRFNTVFNLDAWAFIKLIKRLLLAVFLIAAPSVQAAEKVYTFGVVPQQAASEMAEI